jgi:hypothetical protein
MKLQYFVYFLNKLKQQQLFLDKRGKIEILKDILTSTKPITFDYRGVSYAYVFVRIQGNYILAKFGRRSIIKKCLPPEDSFEEINEENWPYVSLFINLSDDHNNGQQIAFELNSDIFPNPYSQLKSFSEEISSKIFSSGYIMQVSPVTVEKKFWDIIKDNENKIEKISFSFNAPNLFNLGNSLEQDLKDAQKDYSITKAKIELENPYGLLKVPKNDFIEQGAEYIARGGGEYKITVKGKRVISNKRNVKTKAFEDLELTLEAEGNGQASFLSILDKIFN